jgi:hypothetical protein
MLQTGKDLAESDDIELAESAYLAGSAAEPHAKPPGTAWRGTSGAARAGKLIGFA